MNTEEYCDVIMDREMFDFWIESSKELEVIMMKDEAGYHKKCTIVELEKRWVDKLKPSRNMAFKFFWSKFYWKLLIHIA